MRHHGGPRSRHFLNEGPQNRGQGDFSQIPEREAGNRDADLHSGNDATEIAEEMLDDPGARIALFHKLANTRQPDGNESELGCREKRVYANQQKYAEKMKGAHRAKHEVLNSSGISRLST